MTGLANGVDHVESESSRSVAMSSLSTGTLITLHTRNTCYRMQVLDGAAGRVVVTGGLLFPVSTEVEVIGAVDDEGVRVGWVVEGLRVELSTSNGPILTSMVVQLRVEVDTTRSASSASLSGQREGQGDQGDH